MASGSGVTLDKVTIQIQAASKDANTNIRDLSKTLSELKDATKGGFNNLKKLSESLKELNSASKGVPAAAKNLSQLEKVTTALNKLSSISTPRGLKQAVANLEKLPAVFASIDTNVINNVGKVSDRLAASLEPLAKRLADISNGLSALSRLAKTYGISITKVANDTNKASAQTSEFNKSLGKNKKVYKELLSHMLTIDKVGNNVLKKLNSKLKQIALSLLGTRTIFTMTRKAVSEYMAMDKQLTDNIQNTWRALGAQLAPAIEYVMYLFKQFVRVIYSIIYALTGVDLIARANARAMANMGKSAKDTLGSLQKFDDLNVAEFDKGGGETPQIELEKIDLSPIQEIIDALRKLKEAFKEAWATGEWEGVFTAISGVIDSIVDKFLEIDGEKLGKNISKFLVTFATGIWRVIRDLPFGEIGLKLNEILKNIDWGELFTKILAGLLAAFGGIAELLFGALFGVEFKDRGQAAVWGVISLLALKVLPSLFTGLFGSLFGLTGGISQGAGNMLKSMGTAVQMIAVLGGLALVFTSLSTLMETLSNSGIKVSEVLDLLLVSFVVIAGLMATVALLGPKMTAGMGPFSILMLEIAGILTVMALTLPTILDACGRFIETIAPPIESILKTMGGLITNIIYALGTVLPPIIRTVGSVFNTVFKGIENIIRAVGDVIVRILNAVGDLVDNVLTSILRFIRELGPAINVFVDSTIKAITKLINFIISGVEFFVNGIIKGINGLSSGLRKVGNKIFDIIGVDITFNPISTITLDRFAPKLETGTNEVPYEGLYHLHEGEAVVPKKYNPALGNVTNEETNQKLDTLIYLMENMNFTNVVNIGNETLYKKQQAYNKKQNDKYGTTVNL